MTQFDRNDESIRMEGKKPLGGRIQIQCSTSKTGSVHADTGKVRAERLPEYYRY